MSKSIQLREKIIRRLMELDEYDLEKINLAVKAVENSKKNELHYFGHLLGIQFTNRPNKAEMLLSSNIWNSFGVVQGGALYSFADISMGFYIKHLLGEKFNIVTLELKMNYINQVKEKKVLRSIAWVYYYDSSSALERFS